MNVAEGPGPFGRSRQAFESFRPNPLWRSSKKPPHAAHFYLTPASLPVPNHADTLDVAPLSFLNPRAATRSVSGVVMDSVGGQDVIFLLSNT